MEAVASDRLREAAKSAGTVQFSRFRCGLGVKSVTFWRQTTVPLLACLLFNDIEKGKLVERRGRKATGLRDTRSDDSGVAKHVVASNWRMYIVASLTSYQTCRALLRLF